MNVCSPAQGYGGAPRQAEVYVYGSAARGGVPPPAKVQPKSPKRGNPTAQSPQRSIKPFKPSGQNLEEEAIQKIKDFHTRYPYAEDIHETHKLKEASQKLVDFMSAQPEITPQMRSILVDWLGEVSEEYDLAPDTLFLAVNYIDRFLSACVVQRCQLQLVGITCMLIACKYEEIQAPFVEDFVHITDCTYTREEILKTELYILNKLNFSLTVCTIRNFLPRFMCLAELDQDRTATFLSQYLSELSLSIHSINQSYPPSLIASAVVFITRGVLRSSDQWPLVMRYYTGYSAVDLKACVMEICAAHGVANSNGKNPSSKDKYTSQKYGKVLFRVFREK
uniref:Uncharacterized protein n=1 Tax=Arcella intermedia TaxID=1963864 RepID=A0A6B2L9T3_9EUKA